MTARCLGGSAAISRSMASRSSRGAVGSGAGAMTASSDSRVSGTSRAARRRRQDRNSLSTIRLTYRSGASSPPIRDHRACAVTSTSWVMSSARWGSQVTTVA